MSLNSRCEYYSKCAFYHNDKDRLEAEFAWRVWEHRWSLWRQQVDQILVLHSKLDKEIKRKVDGILKIRMPRQQQRQQQRPAPEEPHASATGAAAGHASGRQRPAGGIVLQQPSKHQRAQQRVPQQQQQQVVIAPSTGQPTRQGEQQGSQPLQEAQGGARQQRSTGGDSGSVTGLRGEQRGSAGDASWLWVTCGTCIGAEPPSGTGVPGYPVSVDIQRSGGGALPDSPSFGSVGGAVPCASGRGEAGGPGRSRLCVYLPQFERSSNEGGSKAAVGVSDGAGSNPNSGSVAGVRAESSESARRPGQLGGEGVEKSTCSTSSTGRRPRRNMALRAGVAQHVQRADAKASAAEEENLDKQMVVDSRGLGSHRTGVTEGESGSRAGVHSIMRRTAVSDRASVTVVGASGRSLNHDGARSGLCMGENSSSTLLLSDRAADAQRQPCRETLHFGTVQMSPVPAVEGVWAAGAGADVGADSSSGGEQHRNVRTEGNDRRDEQTAATSGSSPGSTAVATVSAGGVMPGGVGLRPKERNASSGPSAGVVWALDRSMGQGSLWFPSDGIVVGFSECSNTSTVVPSGARRGGDARGVAEGMGVLESDLSAELADGRQAEQRRGELLHQPNLEVVGGSLQAELQGTSDRLSAVSSVQSTKPAASRAPDWTRTDTHSENARRPRERQGANNSEQGVGQPPPGSDSSGRLSHCSSGGTGVTVESGLNGGDFMYQDHVVSPVCAHRELQQGGACHGDADAQDNRRLIVGGTQKRPGYQATHHSGPAGYATQYSPYSLLDLCFLDDDSDIKTGIRARLDEESSGTGGLLSGGALRSRLFTVAPSGRDAESQASETGRMVACDTADRSGSILHDGAMRLRPSHGSPASAVGGPISAAAMDGSSERIPGPKATRPEKLQSREKTRVGEVPRYSGDRLTGSGQGRSAGPGSVGLRSSVSEMGSHLPVGEGAYLFAGEGGASAAFELADFPWFPSGVTAAAEERETGSLLGGGEFGRGAKRSGGQEQLLKPESRWSDMGVLGQAGLDTVLNSSGRTESGCPMDVLAAMQCDELVGEGRCGSPGASASWGFSCLTGTSGAPGSFADDGSTTMGEQQVVQGYQRRMMTPVKPEGGSEGPGLSPEERAGIKVALDDSRDEDFSSDTRTKSGQAVLAARPQESSAPGKDDDVIGQSECGRGAGDDVSGKSVFSSVPCQARSLSVEDRRRDSDEADVENRCMGDSPPPGYSPLPRPESEGAQSFSMAERKHEKSFSAEGLLGSCSRDSTATTSFGEGFTRRDTSSSRGSTGFGFSSPSSTAACVALSPCCESYLGSPSAPSGRRSTVSSLSQSSSASGEFLPPPRSLSTCGAGFLSSVPEEEKSVGGARTSRALGFADQSEARDEGTAGPSVPPRLVQEGSGVGVVAEQGVTAPGPQQAAAGSVVEEAQDGGEASLSCAVPAPSEASSTEQSSAARVCARLAETTLCEGERELSCGGSGSGVEGAQCASSGMVPHEHKDNCTQCVYYRHLTEHLEELLHTAMGEVQRLRRESSSPATGATGDTCAGLSASGEPMPSVDAERDTKEGEAESEDSDMLIRRSPVLPVTSVPDVSLAGLQAVQPCLGVVELPRPAAHFAGLPGVKSSHGSTCVEPCTLEGVAPTCTATASCGGVQTSGTDRKIQVPERTGRYTGHPRGKSCGVLEFESDLHLQSHSVAGGLGVKVRSDASLPELAVKKSEHELGQNCDLRLGAGGLLRDETSSAAARAEKSAGGAKKGAEERRLASRAVHELECAGLHGPQGCQGRQPSGSSSSPDSPTSKGRRGAVHGRVPGEVCLTTGRRTASDTASSKSCNTSAQPARVRRRLGQERMAKSGEKKGSTATKVSTSTP